MWFNSKNTGKWDNKVFEYIFPNIAKSVILLLQGVPDKLELLNFPFSICMFGFILIVLINLP